MTQRDFMIGYGSILSRESRQRSGLTGVAHKVDLLGWRRAWSVRYRDEAATYLGLVADETARLHAVLVPVEINPHMRHRERGYSWTEVDGSRLHVEGDLPEGRFWIVVNHAHEPADADHPIPQTYVDTCLIGALETGGEAMLRDFIAMTDHWDTHWVDDRFEPVYPRRAPLDKASHTLIDDHLNDAGVLRHRKTR
ncbi:hypothetical protein [Maricaulis sp.]|uniref:hypothetical protein n=1 Tax=Maricaulis sp. TaxID=1486257 RepID=UPI00262E4E14|nr:hypothetical protein [Maricaulis sp.]